MPVGEVTKIDTAATSVTLSMTNVPAAPAAPAMAFEPREVIHRTLQQKRERYRL
jgi:hypothetical protein